MKKYYNAVEVEKLQELLRVAQSATHKRRRELEDRAHETLVSEGWPGKVTEATKRLNEAIHLGKLRRFSDGRERFDSLAGRKVHRNRMQFRLGWAKGEAVDLRAGGFWTRLRSVQHPRL
jgi:hypothetical protein